MRSTGILLHLTSLPGPYGSGDFGPESERFLDWLAEAGCEYWQTLPLNPPGYGASPYQSWSAFGLNQNLISPERLHQDGYLTRAELRALPRIPSESRTAMVHSESVRLDALKRAYRSFAPDEEFKRFCAFEHEWLDDMALFAALRQRKEGGLWTDWGRGLSRREPEELTRATDELSEEIRYQKFVQYMAHRQGQHLKWAAHERGIYLVGDLPIFVAHDSADVWCHQNLFHLDSAGNPTVVAGVPPDYFSRTGQRWGNPLYRWDAMRRNSFAWWIARLKSTFRLFDLVRIDHFRGFVAYWEIPADEATAINGRWVPGPGEELFTAIFSALGRPAILAEDLGDITSDVEELRDQFALPGMKVLQFGGGDPHSLHLPHNFTSPTCVIYTGTHDNDTTASWWRGLSSDQKDFWRRYSGRKNLGKRAVADVPAEFIRIALASIAGLAVIPVQDLLGLGREGRMNVPGDNTTSNWSWRLRPGDLNRARARELYRMNELYGRLSRQT